MDLDMYGIVSLGGTAKKDSVIRPQSLENFSEEAYDMTIVGGPKDVKGGMEEGC
jgi:hypothetical protein